MEIIKTKNLILLLLLFTFFYSCNDNVDKQSIIKSDVTKNSTSCFVKQELIQKKDDFIFQFSDINLELKNENSSYNLFINNIKYLTNLTLDSPDINIWYYKCDKEQIILVESDDYYGSNFNVYLLKNENLSYLADFAIKQPNVEKEGKAKKDFQIFDNNIQISINAFLNNKSADNFLFKNKKSIEKFEKNTKKLDINGSWSINCENGLTVFDVKNDEAYLSLYSDNAIYINVVIVRNPNSEDECLLYFKNTESQKNYYKDKMNISDDEISTTETIGKILIKENNTINLQWTGLYNTRRKKLEFVEDFLMIRENSGVNPIILKKCK